MIDNTAAVLGRENRKESNQELRKIYCDALMEAAEKNPAVMAVEVDVMASMGTTAFAGRFPDRSINCGIQEANAIGVAAGFSIRCICPVPMERIGVRGSFGEVGTKEFLRERFGLTAAHIVNACSNVCRRRG